MFLEMTCECGAAFQSEADDNDMLLMLWGQSFVNAHQAHGFMSKPKGEDTPEKTKRYDIIYKEDKEKEI